jgi:hypothetical protein
MAVLLAAERGDDDLTDFPVTSQIRRRLFRGQWVTADEIAHDFDVHKTTLSTLMANLRLVGFDFESEVIDHRGNTDVHRYRLVNPEHEPTDEQYEAHRVKSSERNGRTPQARRVAARRAVRAATVAVEQVEPEPAPGPVPFAGPGTNGTAVPVPAFATDLRVYLLAEQSDGSVTIGLRSGSDRWLASLTGFTRVAE